MCRLPPRWRRASLQRARQASCPELELDACLLAFGIRFRLQGALQGACKLHYKGSRPTRAKTPQLHCPNGSSSRCRCGGAGLTAA